MDPAVASPLVVAAVADLNSWTLDLTKDRVDVTAFQDVNKQRVMGLPDFSGTIGGFWNSSTSPTLFNAVLGDTPVWLRLVPSTLEPTFYFEGLANLDGSINVSATGAVTITGNWDAAGNWDMLP
jgi:hypothetical protein